MNWAGKRKIAEENVSDIPVVFLDEKDKKQEELPIFMKATFDYVQNSVPWFHI